MTTSGQSGGAAPAPRPRTGRPRPIDQLQGVSPVDREKMARFLDAMQEGFERQNEIIASMLAEGNDFMGAQGQLAFSRNAVAILKQLAVILRTGRGGPLSGQRRRRDSN